MLRPRPNLHPHSIRVSMRVAVAPSALLALTALLVLTFLLAPSAPALAAGPATQRADRALDRALRGLLGAENGPPAAVAVVQRGGERRLHRAGPAQVGTRVRPCPRRPMRIASVSKAFSGAAALRLVAAGRLRLSDTIGARLPELPAAWHEVTLRQLLQHTSGLPDFSASREFAAALTESPARAPAPRTLLSYVADDQLLFPPGADYRYSNSDNVVVALMAQEVADRPYARLLRDLLARPLSLRQTLLPTGVAMPAGFLHGYARGPRGGLRDVSEEIAFGGWAWSSGGIVSTPADLTRFVRAYAGGRLFGAAVRRAQLRLVPGRSDPPGPGRNDAGLAIFRYRTPCGTVFGHTGSILGYTQLIAANANGRRSVTVTISTQAPDELIPRLRRAWGLAVCAAMARG